MFMFERKYRFNDDYMMLPIKIVCKPACKTTFLMEEYCHMTLSCSYLIKQVALSYLLGNKMSIFSQTYLKTTNL